METGGYVVQNSISAVGRAQLPGCTADPVPYQFRRQLSPLQPPPKVSFPAVNLSKHQP